MMNKNKTSVFKIACIAGMFIAASFIFTGCSSDSGTGALVGGALGAGVGQLIGGDTKSTAIGAGVGAGAGYAIGRHSDKSKQTNTRTIDSEQVASEETVWITNTNGSQTPVRIKFDGSQYIGPKGEVYNSRPTEEQLKAAYGF